MYAVFWWSKIDRNLFTGLAVDWRMIIKLILKKNTRKWHNRINLAQEKQMANFMNTIMECEFLANAGSYPLATEL
jgi:hypothetical protein